MSRARLPRVPAVDTVLVAALLVLGQVDVWIADPAALRGPQVANAIWVAAVVVPLLWRRRAAVAVFVCTAVLSGAGLAILFGTEHQGPIEPWLALLVALYSLAAYETPRRAAIAVAVVAPFMFAYSVASQVDGQQPGNVWPAWGFYVLAFVLGHGLRRRQRLTAALEERTVQLEHEREQKARVAVIDERARIARELHDVIAHNVSVIVVQASVERRSVGDERPETQKTLEDIEHAARDSLVELRRLLGVLRHNDDVPALAPQPGLGALDALVDQVREAGLRVDVSVEGDPVRLPAGLDLAAYRVLQEALTNTLKHAHASRADVTVRYRPREVALEVVDDGRSNGSAGGTVPGAGQGLVGMRERAELYGGELRTGRRAGGGYAVHARFPLEPAAQ